MIPLCPTRLDSAETHLDLCAKGFCRGARDWENNDTASMELGILAPAYEHAAAAFLKLTGGLETDEARTRVSRCEAWDGALVADCSETIRRNLQTGCNQPA